MSYEEYLVQIRDQLKKAIGHLQYSYKIIITLPTHPDKLDEEMLASWESFSARFSRVVDIFLMKYLKAAVKRDDPAFEGTLRDFLHQGEKLNLIDDTEKWLFIRSLRNITAHEYTVKDLETYFIQIKTESSSLLKLMDIVSK